MNETIRAKFLELAACKFTGEVTLHFAGSTFEGFGTNKKEFRDDERRALDIDQLLRIILLCRRFEAAGAVTMIWNTGSVRNYTIRLTFEGMVVPLQTRNIFRLDNVK